MAGRDFSDILGLSPAKGRDFSTELFGPDKDQPPARRTLRERRVVQDPDADVVVRPPSAVRGIAQAAGKAPAPPAAPAYTPAPKGKYEDEWKRLLAGQGSISAPEAPAPSLSTVGRGFTNTFKAMGESVEQAIGDTVGPLPFLTESQNKVAENAQLRDLRQAFARQDTDRPQFSNPLAQGLYGAVESTIMQLPGIAASVAAGNPAPGLAWAGATSGTQAYGKYRARGATPGEAALGGLGEGGVEIATELIPMGGFVKAFGKEGGEAFLKQALKATMQDVPGEQIATLAQDAIDTAIANPDKTWDEYVAERPEAALVTAIATIGQGTIMTGAGYAAKATADRLTNRGTAVPSMREVAEQQAIASTTPDDEASPIDTADIIAGRTEIAANAAAQEADKHLESVALPKVGKRVVITMPDGTTQTGTMKDVFRADDGDGVLIERDGMPPMRAYRDDLNELGITISEDTGLGARFDAAQQNVKTAFNDVLGPMQAEPGRDLSHLLPSGPEDNQLSSPNTGPRTGPSSSQGGGGSVVQLMSKIRRAESGGKDNAKNPLSSATGRYQFVDSTWLATYRAEFGKTGESDAQILAKRGDGELQDRLMRRFTEGNQAALKKAGHADTAGNLYLAHFAGSGGANKVLSADPNASVESVLGAGAVAANPFLKGMTAGQLVGWAARKMGGSAPTYNQAAPDESDATLDANEMEPFEIDDAAADRQREQDNAAAMALLDGPEERVAPDIAGEPVDKEWVKFKPESGTLDIPREEMPQIKAENRGAMVNFLNARGIQHAEDTVAADSLKPTQAEFSTAKVKKAMEYEGGDRAILVSQDGHVVDGHHQWLASRDKGEDIRVIRLDAPVRDIINTVADMPSTVTAEGADVPKVDVVTSPTAQTSAVSAPETPAVITTRSPQETAVSEGAESRQESRQESSAPQETAVSEGGASTSPPISPPRVPAARVEATSTGKSVAVIGASEAELSAISAAIPNAKPMVRKDGATVYSAKYGPQIKAAIANATEVAAPQAQAASPTPAKSRTGRVKSDKSLIEWIADTGGIWDGDPNGEFKGGDLKSSGLADWHKQKRFRRKAIRDVSVGAGDRGMDTVLRDAIEAGYFPELEGRNEDAYENLADQQLLLDAINEELAGKPRYSSYGTRAQEVGEFKPPTDDEELAFYKERVRQVASDEFGVTDLSDEFLEFAARRDMRDLDTAAAFIAEVNAYASEARQRAFEETTNERYINDYEERSPPTSERPGPEDRADEADQSGQPGDVEDAGDGARRSENADGDQGPSEQVTALDRGEAVDPALAERTRTETKLRADAPLRGSNKTGQDQDGTMGLGLFDANDQPQMDLAPKSAPSDARLTSSQVRETSGSAAVEDTTAAADTRPPATAAAADTSSTVAAKVPPLDDGSGSWIIRNRETGEAAGEFYERATVEAINQDKYEVLTARQHLASLNEPITDPKLSIPEDLPEVATLTGTEMGSGPGKSKTGMALLRDRAVSWFVQNLKGRTITASDGEPVMFGRRGMKKTTAFKGDEILRLVPAIEALITQGRKLPMNERQLPNDVPRAEMFAGVVVLDGKPVRAGAIVLTDANGRRHYDLTNDVKVNAAGRPDESGGASAKASVPALDASPSDTLNLVILPDDSKSAPAGAVDTAALQARLESYLGRKAALRVVESLNGAAGSYKDMLIHIARDTSQDGTFTLDHEVIHALRDMGVFSQSEWAILAAKAKRDPALMRSIRQRYGKLDAEAQAEEAVSDLFARWQRGDYAVKPTMARIFQKVRDLFEAIGNAFAGRGFDTASGVMGKVASGRVGARPVGSARGGARKDMVVYHGTPHDFDEFSMDAIGTGEGAQAYGHGLYFTDKKQIAEHYRDTLGNRDVYVDGKLISGGDVYHLGETTAQQRAARFANSALRDGESLTDKAAFVRRAVRSAEINPRGITEFQRDGGWADVETLKETAQILEGWADKNLRRGGRLYEVDIPEDGEYLLWDKPLSEQPEKVRNNIETMLTQQINTSLDRGEQDMVAAYETALNEWDWDRLTGGTFYNDFSAMLASLNGQRDADEGNGWVVANPTRHTNDALASAALKEAGIAGIKYLDGGSRSAGDGSFNYVLFDDAPIKVLAKYSIPERGEMVDLAGSGDTGKMGAAFDRWRQTMQDRYLPLLKTITEIEKQTGRTLTAEENPYIGEELMAGRIGTKLEKLAEDHVRPLFDAMHSAKVSLEELETFLYARHAPERNARIYEINPEFEPGEGSGMTDTEAMAILSRIERAGRTEAMQALADRVYAIREMALDQRVEAGLMSQKQADEWRSTYEYYVPLRGFAEVEDDAADADRINRSGGGINVKGRESKAAYGRRSKADSPLSYLIMQAEEAIVRGETNRVAQRFVKLAQDNPDDEFWKVNKATYRRHVNEETGLVEEYLTTNEIGEDKDWTVTAKFNGKQRRVTMNRRDPAARRLADAMRRLSEHEMDWVTIHLGKVNRFLSSVNTSYNPEFVITNAFRDVQTAAFNLTGEEIAGLTRGTLKDWLPAMKAATQGAFGKGDANSEWQRWYEEFRAEGGAVAFNKIENVTEIKMRIAELERMTAAKHGEGGARIKAKRALLAVEDYISNANFGVENAVRLAAYKNARERGLSKTRAASLAKNLTVNFNRRGTAGPLLNAAYLFFNASVQGSARLIMALRSPRVRKLMSGVVAGAFLLEMLNAFMGGDDDDGESFYDKIPAWEKGRNLIVMQPGGSQYIKIPLPYGYNMFYNTGRSMAEIARRGGDRWTETMANYISDLADSFNPIGGSGGLLNIIAPTIADPVVDLVINRDFTGKPIMPDAPPYEPEGTVPDNQRYWGSVSPHWRAVTDFLNSASGGDQVVPGAIDVSPETLEHLAGVVLGAAGSTVDRMIGMVGKGLDPNEEITRNDIIFVRKLAGDKAPWHDKAAFHDRLNEVDLQLGRAKSYIDAGEIDAAIPFVEKHRGVLSLENDAKQARKDMREVKKARRELDDAENRGLITASEYRDQRKQVDEMETFVITGFNQRWNEAMKAGK